MAYSCTDFTDSILEALGIVVPEDARDDPAAQADLALDEIKRLQQRDRQLAINEIDALSEDEACPECGDTPGSDTYGTIGDGYMGLCPSCADKADPEEEEEEDEESFAAALAAVTHIEVVNEDGSITEVPLKEVTDDDAFLS